MRWTSRRTAISGFVSLPRMRLIIRERVSLLTVSIKQSFVLTQPQLYQARRPS